MTDSETVCPDSSAKCCRSRSSIKWRKVSDSSVPKGGNGTLSLAQVRGTVISGSCLWGWSWRPVMTGEGGRETYMYRSTLINLDIKFAVNFTLLHAFSRNELYKQFSERCALSPRKTSSFTAMECTEATTASKEIFLSGCSCFSSHGNWNEKGIGLTALLLTLQSPGSKKSDKQISQCIFSSSMRPVLLLYVCS